MAKCTDCGTEVCPHIGASLLKAEDRARRLLLELQKFAILPLYYCSGDTPEICEYTCQICNGDGDTEDTVQHQPGCLLAAPNCTPVGAEKYADDNLTRSTLSDQQIKYYQGIAYATQENGALAGMAEMPEMPEGCEGDLDFERGYETCIDKQTREVGQ